MKINQITESSPLTFKGSISRDLLESKIWLCRELNNLGFDQFSNIYILGSWYGNLAFILAKMGIRFEKIINVDVNKKYLKFSQKLLSLAGLGDKIQSMNKDANDLNYTQLDQDGLVINTSVHDIENTDWFDNIPKGTLVILQSRNNISDEKYHTIKDFNQRFPLKKTLFIGEKKLSDPTTSYHRFMKIGYR